jgi:hypothetical protein
MGMQPCTTGPTELPLIRPADRSGYPIKTTLIIMPKAIQNQWQDELQLHIADGGLS